MIDWSESMQQTFEYYEVDPNTWKDKRLLDFVKSSSINIVFNSNGFFNKTIYILIYIYSNICIILDEL